MPWSLFHVLAVSGGLHHPTIPTESSWQSCVMLLFIWLVRIWLLLDIAATRIPSVVSMPGVPLPAMWFDLNILRANETIDAMTPILWNGTAVNSSWDWQFLQRLNDQPSR